MQSAEAVVGANPDIAVAIFEERARAEVAQPVIRRVVGNARRTPSAYAFIGSNPHTPVAALQESPDEVVDQSFPGGILHQPRAHLPKRAFPFGTDPQGTLAVAENVADSHSGNSGKLIASSFAVVNAKQIHRRHPDVTIPILVDGFGVGVGGVGQAYGAHRSSAQSQHAALGSDPYILFLIFVQVQQGIAGQCVGSANRRNAPILIEFESVPDGTDPEGSVAGLAQKTDGA